MLNPDIVTQLTHLRSKLRAFDHYYYYTNRSLVDNWVYDSCLAKVNALEALDPKYVSVRATIDKIRKTLCRYEHEYYQNGVSLVPDSEYDKIYKELVVLEEQHPVYIRRTSPTQRVGH